ncbi:predicted protein [Histoplasma capsulatum G186AR]|uniref:Uncharacterized protein n=1 Tax=Ajellomyces capsulatus (strain G186AR / H82 / ATCC MYA-2454 / RMSCC 2432) TaxID=447093 RepID=C0P144_AJECG|nr:uncharacterized protein HCBG_09124 [Histoplasma capsulatum G186AR]EEH02680.1 predicted protein [Histoplasma capsulatum G186AR]
MSTITFHVQLLPGTHIETTESTNIYGVDEGTGSGWWLQNVENNVTRESCQRSEMQHQSVIQNQLASSDGNGRVQNKRETNADCFWRIQVLKIVHKGRGGRKRRPG